MFGRFRVLTRAAAIVTIVLGFALTVCGCPLLLVGGAAAAGAGGALYYTGRLEQTLNHPLGKVHAATLKALAALELPVQQDSADKLVAVVESRFADGKKVHIELAAEGEKRTRVRVRVGDLGDKERAQKVLQAIIDNL